MGSRLPLSPGRDRTSGCLAQRCRRACGNGGSAAAASPRRRRRDRGPSGRACLRCGRSPALVGSDDVAERAMEAERPRLIRSEEHTSELQSLMRISYAVFCLKKKKKQHDTYTQTTQPLHSQTTTNYNTP